MDKIEQHRLLVELQAALGDQKGWLGTSIPQVSWRLPNDVRIEGENLVWRMTKDQRIRSSTRGALDEFLKLAFPSDLERQTHSDVLAFAQGWGTLQLCRHGLHYRHPPRMHFDESFIRCHLIASKSEGWSAEPIAKWRRYSDLAFFHLREAADLRSGGSEAKDRSDLLRYLNGVWLNQGSVGFRLIDRRSDLRWPGGLQAGYAPSRLFGVLAAQVTAAAMSIGSSFACWTCGNTFTPDPRHRPRTGQRAYCQDCGAPAARRMASKDYRDRIREARDLKSKGLPVDEIAQRLNRSVDIVRKWLARK